MTDPSREVRQLRRAHHKEHLPGEETPVEQQTLLEQMGGVSGLVSATLPVVVLIPVNNVWGLAPALLAAVGVALLILIWCLVRKQTLQPAISGFMGVAVCAAIAWFTGDAKGYFLYGIWASLVMCIAAVASVVFRWPAVGVIWKGINGEDMRWRSVTTARRAYVVATLGWATVFFARFVIQHAIYDSGDTTVLGVVRIIMGWPLTAVVTLLTVFMVKRANKAVEQAVLAGEILSTATAEPTQEPAKENRHD